LIPYFGPEILEVLEKSLRPQREDIPRVKAYEESPLSVLILECGRNHTQAHVEHKSLVSVCMSSFAELRDSPEPGKLFGSKYVYHDRR
jgi:hypothetical protein